MLYFGVPEPFEMSQLRGDDNGTCSVTKCHTYPLQNRPAAHLAQTVLLRPQAQRAMSETPFVGETGIKSFRFPPHDDEVIQREIRQRRQQQLPMRHLSPHHHNDSAQGTRTTSHKGPHAKARQSRQSWHLDVIDRLDDTDPHGVKVRHQGPFDVTQRPSVEDEMNRRRRRSRRRTTATTVSPVYFPQHSRKISAGDQERTQRDEWLAKHSSETTAIVTSRPTLVGDLTYFASTRSLSALLDDEKYHHHLDLQGHRLENERESVSATKEECGARERLSTCANSMTSSSSTMTLHNSEQRLSCGSARTISTSATSPHSSSPVVSDRHWQSSIKTVLKAITHRLGKRVL